MKLTISAFSALKGAGPIPTLTAADFTSARLVQAAGIPLILVGDSLGMTVLGHSSTLPVTLDDMLRHTAAVVRGAPDTLIVADLPFLSYQVNDDEALRNAGRFLAEAGADAVKLEGGADRIPLIRRLVRNGIPVMGHIGLTPQSVKSLGYKVQGRSQAAAQTLREDARALADAGAFALVLEAVPAPLAAEITADLPIPTIGIGAGPGCDGQILVFHDVLGLYDTLTPKFVKQYAHLTPVITDALRSYADEVRTHTFPAPEHTYA